MIGGRENDPLARPPRLLAAGLALFASFSLRASCSGPPTIRILSPAHGTFSASSTVKISGDIKNIGIADAVVSVNGAVVPVQPNKTWSVNMTLNPAVVVNPFLAQLTKVSTGKIFRQRIVVLAGNSIPDGMYSPQSLALRLNDSGLATLGPKIKDLVPLDLATLLPSNTVIIPDYEFGCVPFLGCGHATVRVSGSPPPSISDYYIAADSLANNDVRALVTLDDLFVRADVNGTYALVPFTCHFNVSATQATITSHYVMSPLASDSSNVDVNQNGNDSVSTIGFSDGGGADCNGMFGGLVALLINAFVPNVQGLVTDGLVSFLADPDGAGSQDTPIAAAIQTALGGIPIAGPLGDSLGVNLETSLFDVLEDAGGVTLGSDTRVFTTIGTGPGQCQPPPGTPDFSASYHVVEAFPTFGTTAPVSGSPYDLGLCINSSAFNQLLKAEVECGLLKTELTEIDLGGGPIPITSGLLGLFIPQFAPFNPPIDLKIRLSPTLAPIVTGNTGPAGELAEMRIGQLLLEIVGVDQDIVYLAGAADVRFGFDISLDAQTGTLTFALSEPNPSAGDVKLAITNNLIQTDEATVEGFLPFVVAPLFPSLSDSLGSLPLPQFFGLGLGPVEVSRNGQFMSVFADLVPVP